MLYKEILYQILFFEGIWQQRKKKCYNLIEYKQHPNESKTFMSQQKIYLIFKLQTFPYKDKGLYWLNNTIRV